MAKLIVSVLLLYPLYLLGWLVYSCFFAYRQGRKWLWWLYCAVLQGAHLADNLYNMSCGSYMPYLITVDIAATVLLPLMLWLCFEGRPTRTWLAIMPYTLVNSLLCAPFMMPFYNSWPAAQTAVQALPSLLIMMGSYPALWLTVWIMKKFLGWTARWPQALVRVLGILSAVLFAAMNIQQYIAMMVEQSKTSSASVLQLGLTLVFAIMTLLVFALPGYFLQRRQLAAQAAQQREIYAMLQSDAQTLDRMHLAQHDMQNHFVTIQGFLQRGDTAAAKSYIDALLQAPAYANDGAEGGDGR